MENNRMLQESTMKIKLKIISCHGEGICDINIADVSKIRFT